MTKQLLLSLCVAGTLALIAHGQTTPPERGRVLILRENEKTWTGDIERDGDEYRVKRLVGETRIPADSVLKLCASFDEAFLFMQSRANLRDPDERIRLADWCYQHNLREHALAEAHAALALRENDARANRLVKLLKNKTETPRAAPLPERPLAQVDVTAESLAMFASKVQPILMNTCVSCHNVGRNGSFQLTRTSGGLRDRRSLDQNLAAVVAEINPHEPGNSRLLLKALSIHARGMTQAPIRNRESPAFVALESWVKVTVATNPQLKEQPLASAPAAPPPASATFANERPAQPEPQTKAPNPTPPSQPEAPVRETLSPPAPTTPIKAPTAKETPSPVDPDAFNREFHPIRKD